MKKHYFFAAVALVTLASCSEDSPISGPGESGKEIGFRTVTDKGTRAAVTDATNMLSFTVTGWWDQDGTNSYGNVATGGYLFDAKDITRGEAGGTAWEYSPKRYWPITGAVDFFAYSPASSKNLTKGVKGLDAVAPEIVYTVPTVAENNAQEDFLVATLLNAKSGTVMLNFQHALSRVKFKAKKEVDDVEYLIDGIELVNLHSTAELDITALGTDNKSVFPASGGFNYDLGDPVILWTKHSTPTDYVVDFGESPVYVKQEDYISVLGETNGLMVMPQETKLGEVYINDDIDKKKPSGEVITPADVAQPKENLEDCFYIKVSYKAFQGAGDEIFYYAGSATTSRVMYIPVRNPKDPAVGLTFEIGRQYIFLITFGNTGGGTGELGEAIIFDVNVQPWDDVEVPL